MIKEVARSDRTDFDISDLSSWLPSWSYAVIRLKTGLLDRCMSEERVARRLINQFIVLGTAADHLGAVDVAQAEFIVITKEAWWFYFYPFRARKDAENAMKAWRFSASILFKVDLEEACLRSSAGMGISGRAE
ncbi:unnamed protein product [Symbiodinium natans]|uniref:Uncharacterized protein n=1 Tax=Symbiodinium natans TaxID=878477 RepID=A0A812UCS4_9DINO|nr:unnamed protein product [Symbiodinium natans]